MAVLLRHKVNFLIAAAVIVALFGLLIKNGVEKNREEKLAEFFQESPAEVWADNALSETNPSREYVTIFVKEDATPQNISGWTIANSRGERFVIPKVANNFVQGAVNQTGPLVAPPTSVIHIISGESPLGVSFQKNACTEMLEQYQNITPSPFKLRCMVSSTLCESLPYPDYPSCIAAMTESRRYYENKSISENTWYVYLNSDSELWRGPLDTIKIYDAKGGLLYFSFIGDVNALK